jgi:hypothetical protein
MLSDRVAGDLSADVPREVRAAAALLAGETSAVAVLFYGSVLRTGNLDDLLDFYVLTSHSSGSWLSRALHRVLWPDVTFRELSIGGRTIRAKVATMPLATFERAASGRLLDTTIWTRFAQPSACVWTRDETQARRVADAIAAAIVTAARFAAAVGPAAGNARAYWLALFAATYRMEFRVENAKRGTQLIDHAVDRYEALLPLAWDQGGVSYDLTGDGYRPMLPPAQRRKLLSAWRLRTATGKLLNVARLVKAAFTFKGAARYALWKIERHTGVHVEVTPWRERHPILAAPGVLWRVFRAAPR